MATEKGAATVKAPARAGGAGGAGGNGFFERAGKYLSEVRTELRKTTWPTRAEVIAQTQVVLGLLVVVGVFIAGWDFLLGRIFDLLLRMIGVENTR